MILYIYNITDNALAVPLIYVIGGIQSLIYVSSVPAIAENAHAQSMNRKRSFKQ